MAGERTQKYLSAWTQQASERLGEPVEAVGLFSRTGAFTTAAAYQVSGGLGMLLNFFGKKKGGGLPMNVLAALTADKVHVFDYRPRRTKIALEKEVATWDRHALQVSSEQGASPTTGPLPWTARRWSSRPTRCGSRTG